MAQTTVNVRMDDSLKQEFDSICNELGMTMSTAITMLAKKMTREKRLPFDVRIEEPNETTYAAMETAERGEELFGPFDCVADLMEALDAES